MTTQISTKLAALSVALMMNGGMSGAVAYLFNGQIHTPTVNLVHTTVRTSDGKLV